MNPYDKGIQGIRIIDGRRLLSRQRRWQLRQQARGKCEQCGRRAAQAGKRRCKQCGDKNNEKQQQRKRETT